MSEKGKSDVRKDKVWFSFDIDKIETMVSGSCFIHTSNETKPYERYAVCKEGQTIKIFKVVEEKG